MRLVKTLPILLSLGAALGSASAWSLPNDQQQPIRIQADDAQLDDKNGIATYKGDVIITQGSMKVTGNTVTITRTPTGDIDVVTSVGNLAYFEQLQTANDSERDAKIHHGFELRQSDVPKNTKTIGPIHPCRFVQVSRNTLHGSYIQNHVKAQIAPKDHCRDHGFDGFRTAQPIDVFSRQ